VTTGLRAAVAEPSSLGLELEQCDRFLARHLQAAVRRFGAAALGLVDLPALGPGTVDAEAIRVAAVLLWAREIERAGLPAFVEALAQAFVDGRLALTVADAGDRLVQYHRERQSRFTAAEREAVYEHTIGGSGDTAHPVGRLIAELAALLSEIGRTAADHSTSAVVARVGVVGLELGEELSNRAVGISAFLARDVTENIRRAWGLLQDAEIVAALGGGGAWSLVRSLGPGLLGRAVDPPRHLARARAGQQMLSWLAEHADALSEGLTLDRADPVVPAAQAWEAQGDA
jgi:hypothetical protein